MRAVTTLTRPGDVVLDLGAGSGILSFAAAAAGAGKVHAVELDALLAEALRRSIRANGYDDVIEVIEGDALELEDLRADVLLAELIDTGLMDEQFVPAMNRMWEGSIVDGSTRLLFQEYSTTVQLTEADNSYYGFTILAPKHEWPFYGALDAGSEWEPTTDVPLGEPIEIWRHDFRDGPVPTDVGPVRIPDHPSANAVTIAGSVVLGDGQVLGAYNSFNGAKVMSLAERPSDHAELAVSYRMGDGLGTFCAETVVDLRAATQERGETPVASQRPSLPGTIS